METSGTRKELQLFSVLSLEHEVQSRNTAGKQK